MSSSKSDMLTLEFVGATGETHRIQVSSIAMSWLDRLQREEPANAHELVEQLIVCLDELARGVRHTDRFLLMEMLLLMIREALRSESESRSEDAMVSCAQAALEIGAHVSSVRQAAQSGRVLAVKRGRTWYVRRGDLRVVRPRSRSEKRSSLRD